MQAQGILDLAAKNAKLAEAVDLYRHIAAVNSSDKEGFYSLGVIAWAQAYQPSIADGISNLEQTLRIDPDHDDEMVYMNLLFRLRAYLSETGANDARQTALANQWVGPALDAKKRNTALVQNGASGSFSSTGETTVFGHPLRAAPPRPPPPRRPDRGCRRSTEDKGCRASPSRESDPLGPFRLSAARVPTCN